MACAAQAARIDLPNAGWSVNWSGALSSKVSVQDAGSTSDQAHVALKLIFDDASMAAPGFFNPLVVVFNQISTTVAPQFTFDTTFVNNTSVGFDGFRILLMTGANTQFDVADMKIGQPGGLDPAPFNVAFAPDHLAMYLFGGNLSSGQSFTLSHSVGVMVASGSGNDSHNAFVLKLSPTPATTSSVPEPTSLGVLALGMMVALMRRRSDSNS